MLMRNDSVFIVDSPVRSVRRGASPKPTPSRTRREVVMFIDATTAFGRGVLQGVARYNRESGGWLICLKPTESSSCAWLRSWRGDGVLLLSHDADVVEAVQRAGVPTVNLGSDLLDEALPRVQIDPVQAARVGQQHLVERGMRHFGYVAAHDAGGRSTDAIGESFGQEIEAAGFVCHVFPVLRRSERASSADHQEQERLARWLEWLPKPVGIMTGSDTRGLEVTGACSRIGAAVPDEVAVIGVGNDEPVCELSIPALSSVDVNSQAAGYEAAALLDRLMDGEEPDRADLIKVAPRGVVARQSTDRAASDDEEIGRVVRYIRDHACRGLQVAHVLAYMAMSRGSLQQRMKHVMGRTIHQEIQRVRLDRARDLLTNSQLAVKQVAKESGFASVQYMTRVFRSGTGETPASYRKRRAR